MNHEIFAPPIDPTEGPQGIGYFSFVTLTTLGFGDIARAVNWVRGVVVLEALAGQIFLVVLVARLVGMQVAQRPSDDQLSMSGATSSGSEAK